MPVRLGQPGRSTDEHQAQSGDMDQQLEGILILQDLDLMIDEAMTIRDQVGSCTFLTASVPDAGGTITVSIDGAEVPYDPANASGWSWGDRANGEVLFFGEACETVAQSAHAIEATVTCDAAGSTPPDESPR